MNLYWVIKMFVFIIGLFFITDGLHASWSDKSEMNTKELKYMDIVRSTVSSEGTHKTIIDSEDNEVDPDSTNIYRVVNGWDGSESDDWHNVDNWTLGHVPTLDEDIVIPRGTPNQPIIYGDNTASCSDLEIQSGAVLTQHGASGNNSYLRVYGDFNSDDGQFIMNNNYTYLYFDGSNDNYWDDDNEDDTYANFRIDKDISTATTNMWQDMTCSGTFEIREGVFGMSAGHTLTITNSSSNAFEVEDGGKLFLDNPDEVIHVSGDIVFRDGSNLETVWNSVIYLGGDLLVENNTLYDVDIGALVLDGSTDQYIKDLDGGNLRISQLNVSKPSGTCYLANEDLHVEGWLYIYEGVLSCRSDEGSTTVYDIYCGSWQSNIGEAGFDEATGRVIIKNDFANSRIRGTDVFHELEINNPNYTRIEDDITCEYYEWTQGTLEALTGASFTANDLINNGIYGDYIIHYGSEVNLTNNDGFVDINGSISFDDGGTMNVYGGTDDSYWGWSEDASITMDAGTLDFHDVGIHISNSAFSFTEDITGGTIRTAYNFLNNRADFNPAGGTIELYGPTNATISMFDGSHFNDILINKSSLRNSINNDMYRIDRNGNKNKFIRTNTVNASSNVKIIDDFKIDSGVFTAPDTMWIGGDWTNNVGDAGFNEGTGRVIFQTVDIGATCFGEIFNVLEIDVNDVCLNIYGSSNTVTCNTYDWTSGILNVQLGATFTALDLLDPGIYGEIIIANPGTTVNLYQDGEHYIDVNGTLNIHNDGTLNVYGGNSPSWWSASYDTTINMSGGTVDFHDFGIYIYNSGNDLIENITGGTIRTASSFTGNRSDFNPTGGTIKLYGPTDANMSMGAGSNFYNVEINKSSPASDNSVVTKEQEYVSSKNRDGTTTRYSRANTVFLATDCVVDNDLTITEGALTLNGNELTVEHDMYVYGTLNMTNAADVLNVRSDEFEPLFFFSGSTGNISAGNIYLDWGIIVYSGASFTATTSNTIHYNSTIYRSGIANDDPNTVFGNILVDKPSGFFQIWINGDEPIVVDGDFTLSADNEMELNNFSMIIHGDFTDDSTSEVYVYNTWKDGGNGLHSDKNRSIKNSGSKGGSLEIDTDFTLNGLMDVGDGDVLVHGTFELASTGTLTIDGGSFISDAPHAKDRLWQYMYGTLNLSSGLFEITNNSIYLQPGFNDNITGGTIRCGYTFWASDPGIFEPSNNTVELTGDGIPYIQCDDGNFFNNLIINRTTDIVLYTDITITDNLEIISGEFDSFFGSQHNITVGGNWTNNVGDAGFGEGTGTVTFIGINESDITTNETFYNLIVDKSVSGWNVIIEDSVTVNVLHDLNVNAGCVEMNNSSTLDINNNLNIASGAGLNAYLDQNLNIFIAGNWDNDNTESDVYQGFNSGYSTVTFDGNGDQLVTSSCAADTFYNVIIDKADSLFKPTNDTEIFGDLDILNGAWDDDIFGLTHNIYGDVYVASTGDWYGSGCTVAFKGDADQTFEFLTNSYLTDIIVDKSPVKTRTNSVSEEGQSENDSKVEIRGQTVILNSDLLTQAAGTLLIEEGTLHLNGHAAGNYGDIIINDGGKIEVDEDAVLEVGDGYDLIVNSGGILEVIGSSGHEATVTRFSIYDNYDLAVYAGGTIAAEHAIFEYTGFNRVFVDDGGIVDTNHPFDYCTFQNGSTIDQSALLVVNNDQDLTITGAHFPDASSATYNVAKDYNQGTLHMNDATGGFSGEDHEYDPYGLVTWIPSVLPPIDDLSISYTPTAKGAIELNWTYSTVVDSFFIYRDTDPYFIMGTPHATIPGTTTTWSEPATGVKYFYIVTAYRDDIITKSVNQNKVSIRPRY